METCAAGLNEFKTGIGARQPQILPPNAICRLAPDGMTVSGVRLGKPSVRFCAVPDGCSGPMSWLAATEKAMRWYVILIGDNSPDARTGSSHSTFLQTVVNGLREAASGKRQISLMRISDKPSI
jgi:hypothetical protein